MKKKRTFPHYPFFTEIQLIYSKYRKARQILALSSSGGNKISF